MGNVNRKDRTMGIDFALTKPQIVDCQRDNLNTEMCKACEDKFICLTTKMGVESIGETHRKSDNIEKHKIVFDSDSWEYKTSNYNTKDEVTESIADFVGKLVIEVEVDLDTSKVEVTKVNNKKI